MRITLDTAILVRTNVKATGPAKELLKTIERSGSVLVLSAFLIREGGRALKYPRIQSVYRLTDADIQEHIEYLQSLGEIVARRKAHRSYSNVPTTRWSIRRSREQPMCGGELPVRFECPVDLFNVGQNSGNT
jgi:hypothetical protein